MAQNERTVPDPKRAARPAERSSGPDGPTEDGADVERSPGEGSGFSSRAGLLGAPPPVARFNHTRQALIIQRMQRTRGNAYVARFLAQLQERTSPPRLPADTPRVVPVQRAGGPPVPVQRATVIDVNGVAHEEDEDNFTSDANGNVHDAAGNIITFRAPDGVYVEQDAPADAGTQQSSQPSQPSQPPDWSPQNPGDNAPQPSGRQYPLISQDPPVLGIIGPLSDQTIAQDLYGDPTAPVEHMPDDATHIKVRVDDLLPPYRGLFQSGQPPSPPSSDADQDQAIAQMSTADKLGEAIKRADLSPEFQNRIDELLTPESLAMMAGMTAVFIAAQLTPAGWVADLVGGGLVLVSALLMGPEIVDVIQHIMAFASGAMNATSSDDLDRAGHEFAIAVTKVGVDVVMAILLHKVVKGAASEIKGPPLDRFGAMVTPDGQVVRVPIDEVPDDPNLQDQSNDPNAQNQSVDPNAQNQPNQSGGAGAVTLDQAYDAALQAGDWPNAAERLNGFNTNDILGRLNRLTPDQIANLHQGAVDNPRVGPDSQVGRLTDPAHRADLGTDPATGGRFRPNERDTALRVEQARNIRLTRYQPPSPGLKGDWIDPVVGDVYDGCSPPESRFFDQQIRNGNYEASLRSHLTNPNVNYVVVDISGLGLTVAQEQVLEQLIARVAGANNPKIVRVP